MSSKKPDNIVFNEETQSYDASLKSYGTNVGAPAIEMVDTVAWKNRFIHEINAQFKSKYQELKTALKQLSEEFEYNNLVYASKFNFEPIVGKTYHLYKNANNESFLSIIAPQECNFEFLGSFYLNSDKMWKKQ
ncbi:DUF2452 domain-containing protein [Flavicella sediminum]|uniref:DUF2452 domain-containing protein n=1 Tax=Flavicella sediminum TaxID=2585141 RepID=UPI0011238AC3|nr:DUF2452 domain-containing protein [Flavicella sediminum]